jgi:hypothetical protein
MKFIFKAKKTSENAFRILKPRAKRKFEGEKEVGEGGESIFRKFN